MSANLSLELIKCLINQPGVDVNVRGLNGKTPLHYAVEINELSMVALLLNRKNINPLITDDNGKSVLDCAREEILQALINHKYGLEKDSLLHLAAMLNEANAVRFLLDKGTNVNEQNALLHTPLHLAAGAGHEQIVEILIREGNADKDVLDARNHAAIHYAVNNKKLGVVKLLSNLGANVNVVGSGRNAMKLSSLHVAISSSNYDERDLCLDIVRCLINVPNAGVNLQDYENKTPLHYAERLKTIEVLLTREDIDPLIKDDNGKTPFCYAKEANRLDIVKILASNRYGADKNSLLHLAARKGYEDLIDGILGEGVEIDAVDESGKTGIYVAVKHGHFNVVKLLLKRGADATDVFQYAIITNNAKLIKLLSKEKEIVLFGRQKNFPTFHRLINDYVDSNVDAFRYSYIGRQNKTDNVLCTYNSRRLTRNDNRDVFINSGGGLSKNEKDTVDNCKKVAIAPYTKVTGAENDYTFYIKTTDYEAKDLYSEIDVKGTGTVIFPETNLLDDCDEISYFSTNNTLSLKIGLGQGNQYTLDIKNYIKQGSNQPNFMLIDKNGSNIIPKIEKLESSITKINSFELHTEHSLDSFDAAENHYKEILINNKDYKVFGVVRAKLQSNSAFQHMVFGSSGEDIINFDQRSMFARGGNGSDMYVIDSNTEKREIIIDNNSDDKKLDMLVMPEVPEEFSIQQCNLHLNYSNTHVQVRNYLKGNSYRHLMVMNSKGETFIPYVQSMSCAGSSVESGKLSPFFHATQTQNMFLLPKDFEGDHVVIDSNLEDIEKYKDEDDLLLTREGEIPFIIRVEDFYNDQSKWRDVNFLLWNNGNFFSYLGLQQEVDGIMYYQDKLKNDYEKIIKEYVIDFTKSISITHNQDGTLTSVGQDEERIGVVILKDITPDQIRVSSSNTDLVFSDEVSNHVINVKNWNNSESYRISTLEFDLGLEPIIIRRLDRFSLSDIAEIQGLINKASEICQKKAGCEANIEAKNNDGQTLFHVAAQEGKLRSIRFLIGKIESMNFEDNLYSEPDELVKAVRQRERLKSLINEKDKFGYTPLQYAAKNGKWDIVNLFLDKTAERNQDDVADKDKFSTSWTTVHYAVYNGNMSLFNDIFQFLSDKETIVNTKDSSDWTPLHYAVYYNALDVVKFLVNKGADISVKDKDSKTPLDLAAQENNTSVAEFLKQTELDKKLLAAVQDTGLNEVKDLINQKANINAKDMYGWTPLHFAASRNKLSVVEFLFNNNANINAKDVYGNTPLHVAAQYSSNLEIVKFLLDKDISGINNITNNGWTPLHVAIQGNKLNTVELLLGRGADIEVRDIYNQTSLDLATRKGYLDIAGILKQVQLDRKLLTIVESGGFNEAKGLIAQGANIDTNDKNGNTLLYSAAEIGDLNLVKLLLDNGANIEAKNGEYQATPLHGAVENYRIDVVKLLLNRGANVNAEDKDNWTPLHYGADTNSPDIVKVLVDAHANLGAKGNYGKTPLDIAKDKGHNNIVEYLEKKLRGGRGERKRRHHHGDHNSHNLSRKPLAIDQPQIATSSGAKPSSWINDLFSRVKSSVGRLLSSKSEGTASSLSQVDGQFAKASISNSSFTGTTLPSDGTDKRQENGGFFRDNVDYVNANLKRMCERQAPVKFKPKDRNTILEMGDHYLSQVDFNGTITLFDLLIRRVTGQKYISTIDQSISPLEAQEYTLNITKGFEKVVEQAGLKSGVSMHRLNIDFVEIQKEVTGKIMSGKFDEISGIFNSYVEKACSGKEAGKLSPKKFEKFIAQFNKGLLNQSIEQILHNRDGRLEVDGTKKQQISLEPQSYLSNASVHSHSEVSTCLSEIGVTKLGGNINR